MEPVACSPRLSSGHEQRGGAQAESRGRWGRAHRKTIHSLGSQMALTSGKGQPSVFNLSQLFHFQVSERVPGCGPLASVLTSCAFWVTYDVAPLLAWVACPATVKAVCFTRLKISYYWGGGSIPLKEGLSVTFPLVDQLWMIGGGSTYSNKVFQAC